MKSNEIAFEVVKWYLNSSIFLIYSAFVQAKPLEEDLLSSDPGFASFYSIWNINPLFYLNYSSYVNLCKLLNCSVPSYPVGNNNSNCRRGWWWGLKYSARWAHTRRCVSVSFHPHQLHLYHQQQHLCEASWVLMERQWPGKTTGWESHSAEESELFLLL